MIPIAANLVIVDWSGIVHGAWHEAGPEGLLKRCAGELLKLIEPPKGDEGYPVERLVLAVDAGLETHRHALTAHLDAPARYKANRQRKPREFWPLVDRLLALVHALRIPTLAPADFAPQTWEADDAAATACRLAREAGLSVLLVSRDKDWRQIVTDEAPAVRWWAPMDEKLLDAAGVVGEHGVPPELLADWLALVGDTSDNVPGVQGIGEKSATDLLRAWPSVAAMLTVQPLDASALAAEAKLLKQARAARDRARAKFEDAESLAFEASRLAERLDLWKLHGKVHAQRAAAELSRKLVELRADVPIEWDPDEALVGGWDVREVRRVLDGLGCGWLGRGLEARPKRAPRKGARSDGRRDEGSVGAVERDRGAQDAAAGVSGQGRDVAPERGAAPGGAAGRPCAGTRGGDEHSGGAAGGGGRPVGAREEGVAHHCSYSGCRDAPAHVEARRLVAAIRTTTDAIKAMGAIRRSEKVRGELEEHAQQALARWRELEAAA